MYKCEALNWRAGVFVGDLRAPCNGGEIWPIQSPPDGARGFLVFVNALPFYTSTDRTSMNYISFNSDAASGWAEWALAHPEFWSSGNPITTRGQIMPTKLLLAHPDLKTQRHHSISMSSRKTYLHITSPYYQQFFFI